MPEKQECDHKFVHLRKTEPREETWHNWVTYDVFYCERCLVQKEVVIPKVERRGW